tara:strand:- start:55 stop:588 length:534 start_codon:yes stop_codon:yes gene_type:complete
MSHYVVTADKNNNLTKTTGNENNDKKENNETNKDDNHYECMICLDLVNNKNKVNCTVCKTGVYHKECLGFWFYKKELENARKPSNRRKKIKHSCTICKSIWEKKEAKLIKYVYIKAHKIYKRNKEGMTVSKLYEKRLQLSLNNDIEYTIPNKKSKKNIFSYFNCFGRTKHRVIPISS